MYKIKIKSFHDMESMYCSYFGDVSKRRMDRSYINYLGSIVEVFISAISFFYNIRQPLFVLKMPTWPKDGKRNIKWRKRKWKRYIRHLNIFVTVSQCIAMSHWRYCVSPCVTVLSHLFFIIILEQEMFKVRWQNDS